MGSDTDRIADNSEPHGNDDVIAETAANGREPAPWFDRRGILSRRFSTIQQIVVSGMGEFTKSVRLRLIFGASVLLASLVFWFATDVPTRGWDRAVFGVLVAAAVTLAIGCFYVVASVTLGLGSLAFKVARSHALRRRASSR